MEAGVTWPRDEWQGTIEQRVWNWLCRKHTEEALGSTPELKNQARTHSKWLDHCHRHPNTARRRPKERSRCTGGAPRNGPWTCLHGRSAAQFKMRPSTSGRSTTPRWFFGLMVKHFLHEESCWIRLLHGRTDRGGGRDSAGGAGPTGRYAVRRMQTPSRGVGRRVGRILGATTRRHSRGATTKQPTMVFPGIFVPSARRRRSRTCRGPIVKPLAWTVATLASPTRTRSPTPY